jgi:ABC-2 type transport system ATP-binding protein
MQRPALKPPAESLLATESPLCCAGLSKAFGREPVLRGVSLAVQRGSILGLIGRSGAGKTTLIRILLGLLAPDAGSACVLGEPALSLTDAVRKRLGYVPQTPDALGWMRVGDMLDFVGSFYPDWDARYVAESLLRWSIAPGKRLAALSLGERQRVALIRALAMRPELLVLDEPASALDPVARRDLLRELAMLAAESGTTVLFSSHIVSDLERVASHVAVLHGHRLLLHMSLDELKEFHRLLQLDAAAASRLPAKLDGELSRRRRSDGGVSVLLLREARTDWSALEQRLGGQLQTLGLEDLFVQLTA